MKLSEIKKSEPLHTQTQLRDSRRRDGSIRVVDTYYSGGTKTLFYVDLHANELMTAGPVERPDNATELTKWAGDKTEDWKADAPR